MPANPLRSELLKLCDEWETPVSPHDDDMILRSCARIECAVEIRAVLDRKEGTPVLSDADKRVEEARSLLSLSLGTTADIVLRDHVRQFKDAVDARHAEMVREVEFWKKQNEELSRGTEALARQIDEANKRSNP